jgi:hypothetical protein
VDAGRTIPEARLVINSGVSVIAIGVGVEDQRELEAIASQKRFVLNVNGFEDLDALALRMAHPLCGGSGKYRPVGLLCNCISSVGKDSNMVVWTITSY